MKVRREIFSWREVFRQDLWFVFGIWVSTLVWWVRILESENFS